MSKDNHHQLLHSTMNKIATRLHDRVFTKKSDDMLRPEASLFNKRHVKNAITSNSFLSAGEKINLYKSYEDALKHDKSSVLEKQKELEAKLTAVKPPLAPMGSQKLGNKNLVVNKASFVRKSMVLSRDKVTKPKMFSKQNNLTPIFPSLTSVKPQKKLSASFSHTGFVPLKTMENFDTSLQLNSQASKDLDTTTSESKPTAVYLKRMNLKLNHMTNSSLLNKFKRKW
jgi:hypothetical protein